MKATISCKNGKFYYRDKNGLPLSEGDTVLFDDGRKEVLYRTESGELGTDATNKKWVESGKAEPCEYGIYPLALSDLATLTRCKEVKQYDEC